MTHSPEPWIIGNWIRVREDQKESFVFRPNPDSIHCCEDEIWTGVKDGDKSEKTHGTPVCYMEGEYSGRCMSFDPNDMARAVACVNACKGFSIEQLTDPETQLALLASPDPFAPKIVIVDPDSGVVKGQGLTLDEAVEGLTIDWSPRKNITPAAEVEKKYDLKPGSLTGENSDGD